MSAQKRQVVRITFSDCEDRDRVEMSITFRPSVANAGPHSAAVQAALEVLEIFAERHGAGAKSAARKMPKNLRIERGGA